MFFGTDFGEWKKRSRCLSASASKMTNPIMQANAPARKNGFAFSIIPMNLRIEKSLFLVMTKIVTKTRTMKMKSHISRPASPDFFFFSVDSEFKPGSPFE